MKIKGKIIGVTPGKSGVNQNTGRKWQKYDVVINDQHFGTFDDQFLRLIGKEGTFEYEENQYGKTLARLPRQNQANQIMEEFGKLNKKLDEILELVSIRTPVKGQEDNQIPF